MSALQFNLGATPLPWASMEMTGPSNLANHLGPRPPRDTAELYDPSLKSVPRSEHLGSQLHLALLPNWRLTKTVHTKLFVTLRSKGVSARRENDDLKGRT